MKLLKKISAIKKKTKYTEIMLAEEKCPRPIDRDKLKEKKKFIGIDGVRYVTKDGWWLARASNTENIIVARCESFSQNKLSKIKKSLRENLQKCNFKVSVDRCMSLIKNNTETIIVKQHEPKIIRARKIRSK